MHKVRLRNIENTAFEASIEGSTEKFNIGSFRDASGRESWLGPKHLMLVSLGGCTALDVVSLLRKMRIEGLGVDVEVEGELSVEHPVVYTGFRVQYRFSSTTVSLDDVDTISQRLWRIVEMSQQRYCGVAAMFRHIAPVVYSVWFNGVELGR